MSSLARKLANLIDNAGDIKSANLDNVTPATPTNVSDQANTSTGYFDLPSGTEAQRPASPSVGMVRYNADTGLTENYNSSGWQGIDAPPTVTGFSGVINADTDATITVNGSNFKSGSIVYVEGDGVGGTPRALVTTYVSSSQLTAATNATSVNFTGGQSFNIKVSNPSGLSALLEPAGTVDRDPVWSTPSGSLGTWHDKGAASVTLSATDPDADTVSYSLESGSLPGNTSLNTSTGVISTSDPSDEATTTTYPFVIGANANGQTINRSFNIIVTRKLDGSSADRAAPSGEYLYNLGETTNGTYWIKPTGYTGAAFQIYVDMTGSASGITGGGGWMRVGYASDYYSQSSPWTNTGVTANPGAYSSVFGLSHTDAQVNAMLATASEARQSFTSYGQGSVGWTYQSIPANRVDYMTVKQFQDGSGSDVWISTDGGNHNIDYWGSNLTYSIDANINTFNNSGVDATDANDGVWRSATVYIRDTGPSKLPIRRIAHADVDSGTEKRYFPLSSSNNYTWIK